MLTIFGTTALESLTKHFTSLLTCLLLIFSFFPSSHSLAQEVNGGGTSAPARAPSGPEPPKLAGKMAKNTCAVTITGQDGKSRSIAAGDTSSQIMTDDTIHTDGPAGCALVIKLEDGTSLNLQANSTLKIDKFVYKGPKDLGDITIDMLTGVTHWATGDAPKGSYIINTPTATIGIRGTQFKVQTGTDVKPEVITVTEGSIFVTSRATARLSIVKAGQRIQISSQGDVSKPKPFTN